MQGRAAAAAARLGRPHRDAHPLLLGAGSNLAALLRGGPGDAGPRAGRGHGAVKSERVWTRGIGLDVPLTPHPNQYHGESRELLQVLGTSGRNRRDGARRIAGIREGGSNAGTPEVSLEPKVATGFHICTSPPYQTLY